MQKNFFLATCHLTLRPICMEDLTTVYAYTSDAEHVKYMKYYPDDSLDICRDFLCKSVKEWQKDSPRFYVFAVLLHGRHIGEVSVYAADEKFAVGELGWIIHRDFCGNGYAQEAAQALLAFCRDNLQLNKVIGCCDSKNTASARIMESLGMKLKEEGILRNYVKRNEVSFEQRYELLL